MAKVTQFLLVAQIYLHRTFVPVTVYKHCEYNTFMLRATDILIFINRLFHLHCQ